MVEIIAFPGTSSSSTVDTSRINLPDNLVTPVPQIGATLDGTLVLNAVVEESDFPNGDWSNQELADLYRVESLLVQAGIKLTTGRGVSDENDPWFVFCRDDGDVFVHLARSDGRYLLDSPGLSGLLEGPDFPTLIDRFVNQLAALRQPEDNGNVVSFRPKMLKDKNTLLHPSVLLAALVWTLFLASDDIASAAEEAGALAESAFLPVDELLAFDQAPDNAGDDSHLPLGDNDTGRHETTIDSDEHSADRSAYASQSADRSAPGPDRLVNGFSAMVSSASPAAQAVSASLAVIAFSYGLYGTQPTKSSEETDNDSALAGLHASLRQIAEKDSAVSRIRSENTPVVVQTELDTTPVVLKNSGVDLSLQVTANLGFELDLKNVAVVPVQDADMPVEPDAISTPRDRTAVVAENAGTEDPSTPIEESVAEKTAEEALPTPVSQGSAESEPMAEPLIAMSFVMDQLGSGSSYQFDNGVVSATLDHDGLDKVIGHFDSLDLNLDQGPVLGALPEPSSGMRNPLHDLVDDADLDHGPVGGEPDDNPVTTPAPGNDLSVVGAQIGQYDSRADQFVMNFIYKSASVEIVHFQTELVIIDMTAIDDATDRAYARSWITDEGHVISTVGHYQNFIDYGMA
ncbi:MAG: hypothetical protein ABJQ21_06465 [Roseibium sp.]